MEARCITLSRITRTNVAHRVVYEETDQFCTRVHQVKMGQTFSLYFGGKKSRRLATMCVISSIGPQKWVHHYYPLHVEW